MQSAPIRRRVPGLSVLAAGLLCVGAAPAAAQGASEPGAVFSMSNDRVANTVTAFQRSADGTLGAPQTVPTGGQGSGTPEDSANGLVLANRSGDTSPNNITGTAKFLFATNTGSDSVTVFRVRPDGIEPVEVQSSGGAAPISVSVSKGVVYVLNAGGPMCSGTREMPNVMGFRLGQDGTLEPIPGSKRFLSGGAQSGCNQVSFTPDGQALLVTQQQADTIDAFRVLQDGTLAGPVPQQTTGNGPFGFAFTQDGELVTTENFGAAPGQGGAASYEVARDGALTPIGPTVRNGQSDTCWVQITDDGKLAFTASFGDDGTLSSYRVAPDGSLVLINGQEESVGSGASDLALSGNSRYLYAQNSLAGTITAFRVEQDGDLTRLQTVQGGGALGQIGISAT